MLKVNGMRGGVRVSMGDNKRDLFKLFAQVEVMVWWAGEKVCLISHCVNKRQANQFF